MKITNRFGASILALSLFASIGAVMAQDTTTTMSTTSGTVEMKTSKTTKPVVKRRKVSTSGPKMRIRRDVDRLQATLLTVTSGNATLSEASWRTVANEANVLANRIYANARATRTQAAIDAARNLRSHVRELHKSAMAGDAVAARAHAREALPFAYTLDGWAA